MSWTGDYTDDQEKKEERKREEKKRPPNIFVHYQIKLLDLNPTKELKQERIIWYKTDGIELRHDQELRETLILRYAKELADIRDREKYTIHITEISRHVLA